MGMDSNIICVGPFSGEVVDCMNYDKDDYSGVKDGTPVSVTLCGCNTTEQSRELAACLSADPGDFNTHLVTDKKVHWTSLGLMDFEQDYGEVKLGRPRQWQRLEKLLLHGFVCIFQPNY